MCTALEGWNGDGRSLVVEALLDALTKSSPSIASILGSVLRAQDEGPAKEWGIALGEAVGLYSGVSMKPEKALKVDVLIFTIKWPELEACLAAFGINPGVASVQLAETEVWIAE